MAAGHPAAARQAGAAAGRPFPVRWAEAAPTQLAYQPIIYCFSVPWLVSCRPSTAGGNGWRPRAIQFEYPHGVGRAGLERTSAGELRFRNAGSASASFLIQIIEAGIIYMGNSYL